MCFATTFSPRPSSPHSVLPLHGTLTHLSLGCLSHVQSRSAAFDLHHDAAPNMTGEMLAVMTGMGRGGGSESLKRPDSQLCRTCKEGNKPTPTPADTQTPTGQTKETRLAKPTGIWSFLQKPSSLPHQNGFFSPQNLIKPIVCTAPLFNPSLGAQVLRGGTKPQHRMPETHTEDTKRSLLLLMKEKKGKTTKWKFLRPPFLVLEKTVPDLGKEQRIFTVGPWLWCWEMPGWPAEVVWLQVVHLGWICYLLLSRLFTTLSG